MYRVHTYVELCVTYICLPVQYTYAECMYMYIEYLSKFKDSLFNILLGKNLKRVVPLISSNKLGPNLLGNIFDNCIVSAETFR